MTLVPGELLRRALLLVVTLTITLSIGGCGGSSGEKGVDPGIVTIPLAYIKRPMPVDDNGVAVQVDLRDPLFFVEGGDVYLRESSSAAAETINITAEVTNGQGDVKGLNASFDGSKLIFSLRQFDPDPDDDLVPRWEIHEYEIASKTLRRVIPSDTIAIEGDDLFPAYLPDGRIVFSSTRQRKSAEIRRNEGKPGFSALTEDGSGIAMLLHVMDADGSNIEQITFNKSHDLYPLVLNYSDSGQVAYIRWDHAFGDGGMHLYKTNPDGTASELLYGSNSHDTGTDGAEIQFSRIRETETGELLAVGRPYDGFYDGGEIFRIDVSRFVDNERPIASLGGLNGPAQVSALPVPVPTDGSLSLAGRYHSMFPLNDGTGRLLVSKSICQLEVDDQVQGCIEPYLSTAGAVEVPPAYSIWLYDPATVTEKVVVRAEAGETIIEPVALFPQDLPTVIRDAEDIEPVWADAGMGALNILSVYDLGDGSFDGCYYSFCTDAIGITEPADFADPAASSADQRPVRFIRFVKVLEFPDPDDPTLIDPPDPGRAAFGPNRGLGMQEIVGYAPVEPDGSVKVKLPANLPIMFELLDGNGYRIGPRHSNWVQVRPGETRTCNGCHDPSMDPAPIHGRADAELESINSGMPTTQVFINTLIPGTATPYWGDPGQTMAEVRFLRAGLADPVAPEPQVDLDLVFEDYWTDPGAATPDTGFEYRYSNLTTLPPDNGFCSPYAYNCRSVINYEQHIHPLWSVDRGLDADLNGVGDNTCIECHTTSDDMGNDRVADAQLDLTDGISDQNNDQFKAYRELTAGDAGEELDMDGDLVNIQIEVPVLDQDGNPIPIDPLDPLAGFLTVFIDDPAAAVAPTMSANGARRSYFIEKMTETELNAGRTLTPFDPDPALYVDHSTFMTPDEIKLVAEWLDIGVQYFNDPYDPDVP